MDLQALDALGFRQFFRAQLVDLPEDCDVGRVAAVGGGWCELMGSSVARARIEPALARAAQSALDLPVAGDWVAIAGADDEARVVRLFERSTQLVRKAAGEKREPQVIAANVDLVGIVLALTEEEGGKRARRAANPRRLERYLLAVAQSRARAVVLLNKADRSPNPEGMADQLRPIAGETPVLTLSALEGEGVDQIEGLLSPGDTFALVGMSGVGKSTLLNRLAKGAVAVTSASRSDDERGRHTTTRRELHLAPSGVLILDTPGMRELALWADDDSDPDAVFDDISELAEGCRFRDCGHDNEPGCAVQAAVRAGELGAARLDSYFRLKKELQSGTAAQREAKRKWQRSITIAYRKSKNPKS